MKCSVFLFLAIAFISVSSFAKKKPEAPLDAPKLCSGLPQGLYLSADEWRKKCNGVIKDGDKDGNFALGAVQICSILPEAPAKYHGFHVGEKGTRSLWVIGCLSTIKNKTFTGQSYQACGSAGDNDKIISCLANAADKPAPAPTPRPEDTNRVP